jgi:hypothetical protein
MIRAFVIALALSCGAAPSAGAAGPAPVNSESARAIDVLNLITPVVSNGKLSDYLFLSVRIQLADGVDVWKARDKGHFLRDALLKASHKERLTQVSNPAAIDEAAAQAVIGRTANAVLGANAVKSIEILGVTSLKTASR